MADPQDPNQQGPLDDFLQGFQEQILDPIRKQGQLWGNDIVNQELPPETQMGPRGNLWKPGMAPHFAMGPVGPPMPPQSPAAYDQSSNPSFDYISGKINQAEAGPDTRSWQDVLGPIGQPRPLPGSPPTSIPPDGTPKRNEYEAMVKEYLQRLQQPVNIPQRQPLTGIQALAVLMNPDKGNELMQIYDRGYQGDLQKYQLEEGRQAQAASLADRLAERQAQTERQDAQRSWFRESAMANAGAPMPDGYIWKNPELKQVWEEKRHEKTQADQLKEQTLAHRYGGKAPQDREAYLQTLFSERSRLEGLMTNPAAQQYLIERANGITDPTMENIYGGIADELQDIKDRQGVIGAMSKDMYKDFQLRDGATQQKIIREFLDEMKKRQGMPGAQISTATPGGGPP